MVTQSGTVTILFTDLVRSTELLQRAGDEDAQRIFQAHQKLLRDVAERHGGDAVKWLGDGLMVAFPSAADAVRCAITMQQQARRPAGGGRLDIRVGLNAGEALRDEDDYFGTAVVVARRLCDRAKGGQILSSALVAGLLHGRQAFDFRELGSLELKGIDQPVPACEVIYQPSDPAAFLTQTPFVGRAHESERLQQRLVDARAGRGGLVMLVGEPGIGKTRTMEEFAGHARAGGAVVLWGRCYDGEWAPPFGPFAEALAEYVRDTDADALRADLGYGGPPIARLVPALREKLPEVGEPAPLQPNEERFRLLDAVSQFLIVASKRTPLVLVLDDLHWADNGTIAMLRQIARPAKEHAMLILGAYRDVELDRQHPLAEALGQLRRETEYERLLLKGLDSNEVGELLATAIEHEAPADLVEAVSAETDGNPFFVREVLLHLVETGALVRRDGVWATGTTAVRDLGIPEGVRQVIGQRLSRLSEKANALLSAASAFDGEFRLDVAARVAGVDEADALDAADHALAAQVLRPGHDTGMLDFTHALFRHTLYTELSPPRQVLLHRTIAEALASAHNAPGNAAQIAYHYHRSATLPGAERGVDYALAAADKAEASYAYDDVASFLEIALELMAEDDLRKADALLKLGRAEFASGRVGASVETFLRAASDAAEAGQIETLARAALGDFRTWPVEDLRFVPLLEEALKRLPEDKQALRASVLAYLSFLAGVGEVPKTELTPLSEEQVRWLERGGEAVEVARRSGDGSALAFALFWRQFTLRGPQHAGDRVAMARELLTLARHLGDLNMIRLSYMWLFLGLLDLGDPEMDRALAEYSRMCDEIRVPQSRSLAALYRACRALLKGDVPEAEQLTMEAAGLAEHVDEPEAVLSARWSVASQLTGIRHEQGRLSELEDVLRSRVERDSPHYWVADSALTLLLYESSRSSEARERLLRASELQFLSAFGRAQTGSLAWYSEVAAGLDETNSVALLYELLQPYTGRTIGNRLGRLNFGSADRFLGLLAGALRRWEDAQRHFDAALAMNTRMRARRWTARTYYDYAATYVRRGRKGDRAKALRLLEAALTQFRDIGMPDWTRRAEELQQQIAVPETDVSHPDGLTPREVEVLRLIAAGRTNTEIADELTLSVRTVARHITNIYTKIEARNKVEATDYAHRHGLR
jgi:class 3 adenylate cyclase/DNA-binding CsgD family transcriptional regulator/tetratricopeptide (TPR) repeat protein